nr:MAG TPA: hypothetical protein [Caudoviricetes sp.]
MNNHDPAGQNSLAGPFFVYRYFFFRDCYVQNFVICCG